MTDLARTQPRFPSRADRDVARQMQSLGAGKSLQRARDHARAELAAGRIHDLGTVTRVGLAVATSVAVDAQAAAEVAPWAAGLLERVARRGVIAIEQEIAGLSDPFGSA